VQRARELQNVASATRDESALPELVPLAHELVALARAMAALPGPVATERPFEDGLRNHCEGVLRSLVEAAAQEVLDEAKERGSCLAIRATGSLGEVDDELGGAILEILRNLWSDSLGLQGERAEAEIDCVLRVDEDRLVIEVRDPGVQPQRGLGDDDVLANCPGLRRSRPLVESLQGLVWVQPQDPPGCRFRLALPRSTAPRACHVIRVGARAVALPAPALEAVHAAAEAQVQQDGTVSAGGRVLGKLSWPALEPYFTLLAHFNREKLHAYPGSPLLIAQELRPQDRAVFIERHPEEAAALADNLRGRRGIAVHEADGYAMLKAVVPPRENRGLVFIDPPYEEPREFEQAAEVLRAALKRWRNGIYAVWYPIKQRAPVERLHAAVRALGATAWAVEFLTLPEDVPQRLNGSGVLLVNPPYRLDQFLRETLPPLAELLAPPRGRPQLRIVDLTAAGNPPVS